MKCYWSIVVRIVLVHICWAIFVSTTWVIMINRLPHHLLFHQLRLYLVTKLVITNIFTQMLCFLVMKLSTQHVLLIFTKRSYCEEKFCLCNIYVRMSCITNKMHLCWYGSTFSHINCGDQLDTIVTKIVRTNFDRVNMYNGETLVTDT